MFFVYAISSRIRSYIYVGLTDNFDRRFLQHNNGYNKTTKPYRPFQVLIVESYPTRIEARVREKFLKTGQGKHSLKK
ncbi:MAG TPA: GIY-YIG nuclease family protein [Cyclobacteriaceae bacterium]|nr:GIY-YIG nuclease family protein [Cyclobacteriaceae bacterium]